MNRLFHIILFVFVALVVTGQASQEKYRYYFKKGQEQFDTENYREATRLFKAAEISTRDPRLQINALNKVVLADERYVGALQRAREIAVGALDDAKAAQTQALEAEKQARREARFSEALYLSFIADQEIRDNANEGLDNLDTLAMQLAYTAKEIIKDDTGYVESVDGVFGQAVYMATRQLLPMHQEGISTISVNRDGSFVSVGRDSLITAYGYTGTASSVAMHPGGFIQNAQVFNNGSVIVSVNRTLSKVTIWSTIATAGSYKEYTFAPHRVNQVLYEPHGRYLCVALEDDGLHFVDTKTDVTAAMTNAGRSVREIRFSPDSMMIVARGAEGMVGIWGVNGDQIAVFKAHDKYIYGAVFSPDGQQVLTYSADHTAQLWNLDGNLAASLKHHQFPVNHAEYSRDGQHILTTSTGGEACIWSNDGRFIGSLPQSTDGIELGTFQPDNQSVLAVSGRYIHEIANFETVTRSFDNGIPIVGFDISPDGLAMLTWGYGTSVKVWDLNPDSYSDSSIRGHLLMDIALKNGADVTLARFSPDSKRAYVGMADGMIQVVPVPYVTYEELGKNPFTLPPKYLEQHHISIKK